MDIKRLHPADFAALSDGLKGHFKGIGQDNGIDVADGSHHEMRARKRGYGRLPCSLTIVQAVAGAFNNGAGGFSLQQSIKDAMLYLNDDAEAVQDILTLSVGGQQALLAGTLPASTMRDDASLGGPTRGYYLGDIDATQLIVITGTTKLANAIFGFYLVGQYKPTMGRDIGIAEVRLPNPRD